MCSSTQQKIYKNQDCLDHVSKTWQMIQKLKVDIDFGFFLLLLNVNLSGNS